MSALMVNENTGRFDGQLLSAHMPKTAASTHLQIVLAFTLFDPNNALKLWVHQQWPPLTVGQDGTILYTCGV